MSERTTDARLAAARAVLRAEGEALFSAADRLGDGFVRASDTLSRCRGRVAVTGVGKSADVGSKVVGTLNSTGTRAYALDATKAMHGDLGMVAPEDVALVLSHSGEGDELLRLLPPLKAQAAAIVGVTGSGAGTLARTADAAIVYGPLSEACPLSLAPSSSTTVMMAIGDALAFVLMEGRGFTPADFARFHPAGSLGRRLARVDSAMRQGDDLRLARADETVRAVFAGGRHRGRRTGAVMLVDADGRLAGLFTDSDLARLFETRADGAFDRPVAEVMTPRPLTVAPDARLAEAVERMRAAKISELPVIDGDRRPIGLLDITDLIGVEPRATAGVETPRLRVSA